MPAFSLIVQNEGLRAEVSIAEGPKCMLTEHGEYDNEVQGKSFVITRLKLKFDTSNNSRRDPYGVLDPNCVVHATVRRTRQSAWCQLQGMQRRFP